MFSVMGNILFVQLLILHLSIFPVQIFKCCPNVHFYTDLESLLIYVETRMMMRETRFL